MKWSWKIFTAFGIGVYVHITFLLLIFLWISHYGVQAGLMVLALFGCVLLHEFGHALTAKRFGVRTRDITLLPIGGLARLERIPTEPRQEFLIAVAGPAVNIAIAGILYPLGLAVGSGEVSGPMPAGLGQGFIGQLALVNLFLALFNFLPAFPMDGGRVLRSLLAMRLDYLRATRIAVAVGQALAFGIGVVGFLTPQWNLILIAFFVYLGAAQEGFIVQHRYSFQGLPASCAMVTNFNALEEGDRLERAVNYLLLGSQVDFPVLRDHQVVGMLTRDVLIDSVGKHGLETALSTLPLKQVQPLEDDMPLDRAYDNLQEQSVRSLPVVRGGKLVGLLTLENLTEFAMVTSAIRGLRSKTQGPPR